MAYIGSRVLTAARTQRIRMALSHLHLDPEPRAGHRHGDRPRPAAARPGAPQRRFAPRWSRGLLVLVALLTLPVYLSGVGAQREVADHPEVSIAVVRAHHDAALLASVFMLLTGLAAWIGLWQTRRIARPAPGCSGPSCCSRSSHWR
jgi:hypothetical protein